MLYQVFEPKFGALYSQQKGLLGFNLWGWGRYAGTCGLQNPEWNPGTLEPWSTESWNPGTRTMKPWNPGTLEPWNIGTVDPGSVEP